MNLIVLIVIGLLKTIITTSSNITITTENVSTDETTVVNQQNMTNNKQSDINYWNETILNNQNNITTITMSNNIQNVNGYLTTKTTNTVYVSDMNFIFANQNYTSLNSMLNFFNTELLIKHFDQVKNLIGQQCKENLEEYIDGLLRNELWALKMDDSNGRYSGGLLWGNNFWTGSQVQCLEIIPNFAKSQYRLRNIFVPDLVQKLPSENIVEKFRNDTSSELNGEDKTKENRLKRNSKIVSNVLNTDLTLYNNDNDKHEKNRMDSHESWPTFLPSFFTMKIDIYELPDTIAKKRRVQMGVCMPNTCSDSDIKTVVEKIASNRQSVNIVVTKIRSHHQYYNIWKDQLFWVLTFITAVVSLVILAGTIYDYHLLSLKEEKETIVTNISNGNARTVSQIEKHITLDIDKSGRYVVNNNCTGSGFRKKLESYILDILLAFSVRRNLSIICNKSVGSDTLPTIHGLRAISMAWVILGHTCIIVFKYSDNMEFRKVVEEEFLFQTITNGVYSVDTFFFISGLLVSFLYFRTNAKGTLDYLTKGATKLQTALLHFLGLIAYRFARLTVPYIYVMGVVTICMKWYHYNSIFEPPTLDHVNCPNYWWRNVLYINTYFPVEEMCMLWSWYLSNDTQFFIVGSICLILALSHLKLASILLFLLLLSSWATTIYIAFVNNHIPNTDDPLALFDKIYDKPWTRFGPYLIGMLTGYFLFKVDCQIRFSKFAVALGWLLSCSCLMFLIYGPYGITFSSYTGALFSAMSHSVWAISLSWIVIACSTGYGGWANKILSSTILYPFSRVTYCAYLIHPLSIRYMIMQMDSPLHLGKDLMTTIYFGQVVVSYALSFVISLAFEAPIVSTLRILSSKKSREKQ